MIYDTTEHLLLQKHSKGDGAQPSPLRVHEDFDGTFAPFGYDFFGFLGPLGLEVGRFTTPFLKCVSSNFPK